LLRRVMAVGGRVLVSRLAVRCDSGRAVPIQLEAVLRLAPS
jgi:hypothetical protein